LQRDSHAKSQNKTEQKLTRCPSTDWIVLADIYSHYLVVGYIKNGCFQRALSHTIYTEQKSE